MDSLGVMKILGSMGHFRFRYLVRRDASFVSLQMVWDGSMFQYPSDRTNQRLHGIQCAESKNCFLRNQIGWFSSTRRNLSM